MTVFINNQSAETILYSCGDSESIPIATGERTQIAVSDNAPLSLTLSTAERGGIYFTPEKENESIFLRLLRRLSKPRDYVLPVERTYLIPNLRHDDEIILHRCRRALEDQCVYEYVEAECNGYIIPSIDDTVTDTERLKKEIYALERKEQMGFFGWKLLFSALLEGVFGLLALALIALIIDPELSAIILLFSLGCFALTAIVELLDTLHDLRALKIRIYITPEHAHKELNQTRI
ncbi:MAG: hypothetical protein IJY04_00335 [Clostridia bacterium]|nr:hypothetical protein [Clostridia bacterium]